MSKESDFQGKLRKELEEDIFPGCIVLKNDSGYISGIPDLTILHPNGKYAVLECKRSSKETERPNQGYYIHEFNKGAYASFIYPENKSEVINELKKFFED